MPSRAPPSVIWVRKDEGQWWFVTKSKETYTLPQDEQDRL
jgi:hypothetical protein